MLARALVVNYIWLGPINKAYARAGKQRGLGMETLINFFALRPTFTFSGLKIVWYLYLLNTFVQTYVVVSGISRVLAQRGISMDAWLPNSIPLILGLVAQLALVRLLLEVAAIIISSHAPQKNN